MAKAEITLDWKVEAEAVSRLNLALTVAAKDSLRGLYTQLEAGAREAFDAGKDFAVGPLTKDEPEPFSVRDIWNPEKIEIEVKAGPVERGWEPPHGWRVYQRPEGWDG